MKEIIKELIEKFKAQSPRSKIQFLIVIGIMFSAIVFSFFLRREHKDLKTEGLAENTLLVEVVDVSPEDLEIEIYKTGTIEARNFVKIIPEVSGRVTKVNPVFKNGGSFSAHTSLFQVEPIDYQLKVDRASANLKRAETDLMLTQAESESSVAEWKSLQPNKKIPDLVAKIPQLEQSKANLKSAAAELKDAVLDLERTSFELPYAGKIVSAKVELGQFLQAGMEYGEVYALDTLEVVVPIEKEYLKFFQAGTSKAKIALNKSLSVNGTIERLGANLDSATRFTKLYIQADTEQLNSAEFLPGTFVQVKLLAPKQNKLWKIPNEAIQDARHIWIVDQNNRLKKYEPEILSIGKKTSVVKGTGEKVKLVTSMLVGASDGMSVNYE